MRTESQINAEMRSYKSQLQSKIDSAKAVNAQIDSLKEAKGYVKKAKKEAENAAKAAKKLKVSDKWKGSLRDEFDGDLTKKVAKKATSLASEIEEMEADIQRGIDDLKGQASLLSRLAAKIEAKVQDLGRELQSTQAQSSSSCGVM